MEKKKGFSGSSGQQSRKADRYQNMRRGIFVPYSLDMKNVKA